MGEFDVVSAPGIEARVYQVGDPASGAGVVVLHPWWGLNADVMAFADRLAAAGFAVSAPDVYHGDIVDTVEAAEERVKAFDGAQGVAIVRAATADLVGKLGEGGRLGVVGFSLGASLAVATRHPQLAGTVLYYGTGDPAHAAGAAPILGHFAQQDPYEDEAWVAQFETQLRSGGHDVTFHRYPGTGHWFAEPSRDAYRPEAAELAFERTLAFLDRARRLTPTSSTR
jgi:carboxymethylenebutenolidase